MASIIKADTLQSTTSNVFVLNSAGTEYARFDADGDLGIGTSSPDSKLHILNSVGASLRVGYLGGNTNYYDATTHTFRSANGSPSSFISNQYGIGLASTVPSSGVGIAFPASQSASTDANTLDDYEEGTFTPAVFGSSTAGTGTYSRQTGTYTKIGNRVYFSIYIIWSAHTGTGDININGLPFTSSTSNFSPCAFRQNNFTLAANYLLLTWVVDSTTTVALNQYPIAGGGTAGCAMDTSAEIAVSGHYFIA